MSSNLAALCINANDPGHLARFWAALLDRQVTDDGTTVASSSTSEFPIRFLAARVHKTAQNRAHFDLTSASLDDQRRTVARALELGARHVDVGQAPDADHVVLGDPEGNEFCVIEPDNNFLADTGRIGALACDGSEAVGHFWHEALGWPLVWDQDQETAIQSPRGGTKITWGGPPPMPRAGTNQFHLDLVASGGTARQVEVDRLATLGATTVRTETGRVLMADPDGNDFCLLAPHDHD